MTAPAAAMCLLALAVAAWPGRHRLNVARPDTARRLGRLLRRGAGQRRGAARVAAMILPAVGLLAMRVAPWQLLAAGLLAGWTAVGLWRGGRAAARARKDEAGLADALRAVIRELRAGVAPREAAAQACADAAPAARLILGPYSRHESMPLPAAMTECSATAVPDVVVDQLRRAWEISAAHGVPLAAVLAACVGDLDDRAALARLRAQHVAGPAMSGYVLAALPVAGLALGAGMGSHPLDILLGSTTGGVLLVVGVGLCCAGLLWSGRIARGGGRG